MLTFVVGKASGLRSSGQGSSLYRARGVKTLGKFLTSYTSGLVSTEMGDRVRVQFPVPGIHFGM